MRLAVHLCLLLFASCVVAQSTRDDPQGAVAIQRAKGILVSSLDHSLPKVSLEFFLKYEAEDAPIHWDEHDCGNDSDTEDSLHDLSTCVEADFDLKNQAVSIVIFMGTLKAGLSKTPALFSATMTDFAGSSHSLRHLGELPMMLHRPVRRSPKDTPDSGTSIGF